MREEKELLELVRGRRVVALIGAGCSTESGIPDYRGPETARRARNPIQYKAFVQDPEARRRYWARSMIGWPKIERAQPNAAHVALAKLEARGAIAGLITQNVDGLHQKAGSRRLIELHGALARVVCLDCGHQSARQALQDRLQKLNPGWGAALAPEIAPDGDAELQDVEGFSVAPCQACGGTLKPGVVFFGESVPKARVEAAYALFHEAEVLLVVGSSLAVFSGFRFVLRAKERGVPVAIINLGETRGDDKARVRLPMRAGAALQNLCAGL